MGEAERFAHLVKKEVEEFLDQFLPKEGEYPHTIHEAVRYAVFGEAKRIRPLLVAASAKACKDFCKEALICAAAIELVHTYSLVHDDLPCMDNDSLRRGKPTVHKKFGEAVALLAGDALLAHAFDCLTELKDVHLPQVLKEIVQAVGVGGLVAGQVVEIEVEEKGVLSHALLQYIHLHKTAALMKAAARVGAIVVDAQQQQKEALSRFGEYFGLAFQIMDDVKDAQKDKEKGKLVTSLKIYSIERAKIWAAQLLEEALKCVESFGKKAIFLKYIIRMLQDGTT
jgi:geranylgeranyl diphosphate synthase type II